MGDGAKPESGRANHATNECIAAQVPCSRSITTPAFDRLSRDCAPFCVHRPGTASSSKSKHRASGTKLNYILATDRSRTGFEVTRLHNNTACHTISSPKGRQSAKWDTTLSHGLDAAKPDLTDGSVQPVTDSVLVNAIRTIKSSEKIDGKLRFCVSWARPRTARRVDLTRGRQPDLPARFRPPFHQNRAGSYQIPASMPEPRHEGKLDGASARVY